MIPTGPIYHKPKSIIAARNIFHAVIFLWAVILAILTITIGLRKNVNTLLVIGAVLILVVAFILIRQVGFGRNWARGSLLILGVGDLILVPMLMFHFFTTHYLIAVLYVFQLILLVFGFGMAYSKNSTIWFHKFNRVDE